MFDDTNGFVFQSFVLRNCNRLQKYNDFCH